MALIQLVDLSIGFYGPSLLDEVNCAIESRQRIGLLGRNGAGKTTLMRLLSGKISPDHGACIVNQGVTVSQLSQEVPRDLHGMVSDVVLAGLPESARDPAHLWEAEHNIEKLLSQMELDPAAEVSTFSSGMKRRVLLAQTIISKPDVLLLDEPTNHLDIASIRWLEGFLSRWPKTLIFVTHDRTFLQNLASRILEIDRGKIFDWSCDYATFLERKEAVLIAEEKQNALFDKKLSQEEAWIRQGIKARRTRNEGRVRALKKMREERQARRSKVGTSNLQIQAGERSGALVAEVKDVSFAYDEKQIVNDFSIAIMRGDKIGLIGPNGVGKTTLLRILLGTLKPDSGSVRLGTNLQIAYFDQLRQQLDEEKSVQDNVGEGADKLVIHGQPRHVLGYLQDFLFSPERARTQVKFLSGGERNRVLLAKLFSKPANVVVLDEPTNDLDLETLELLEAKLVEFDGTLLIVSHDRTFLNNVVTSTIAFEPDGPKEYVGGYDDWLRQSSEPSGKTNELVPNGSGNASTGKTSGQENSPAKQPLPQRKLTFKEKRELEQLPAKIESLESEVAKIHASMQEPSYFQQSASVLATEQSRLKELGETLAKAYKRWEQLEVFTS